MKIAVVGSGVSGLAATWLLNEHSDHEVHLFEKDDRPGGHANTVPFVPPATPDRDPVEVDTGFIVFNPTTYPNFLRFLRRFGIPIVETEMTFSVSRDMGRFEWAGTNLMTVFAQPSNLLSIEMWRLIYDVLRFNACARKFLRESPSSAKQMSIGEFLMQGGYSASFKDNYLIPMTAAVWSTPPDRCSDDFPARTLIQFLNNHHLLQLIGKPNWLTVKGGSHTYVNKILSTLPTSQFHLSTSVSAVSTGPESGSQVQLTLADGSTHLFDHVVLACHSDTSLNILRNGRGMTNEEANILSAFQWNKNRAVLHADTRLMPKRRLAWSSWNYLTKRTPEKANVNQVSLTYWMNNLQHISEKKYGPVLVTLNPPFEPDARKTIDQYQYDHPVVSAESVAAQKQMVNIQNKRGISYAGAYLAYGFHEDGFTSGLRVAQDHLNAKPPFPIQYPDRDPGPVWPARLFELLELWGISKVLFLVLGIYLQFLRILMLPFSLVNSSP
ncbi:FAD/NAD(P)-binding domain-containing protein, partial [Sistotremastrum niveocremeum HHB9708]